MTLCFKFYGSPFYTHIVQRPRTENGLEILPLLGMGVKGLRYQDSLCNIQQLQGTIIIQTNLIHISVLNNIFLFSKILSILFYTLA